MAFKKYNDYKTYQSQYKNSTRDEGFMAIKKTPNPAKPSLSGFHKPTSPKTYNKWDAERDRRSIFAGKSYSDEELAKLNRQSKDLKNQIDEIESARKTALQRANDAKLEKELKQEYKTGYSAGRAEGIILVIVFALLVLGVVLAIVL